MLSPGSPTARGPISGEQVAESLKDALAEVLFVDADSIDEYDPMADLGLDSILLVELVKKINETFGVNIKATRMYDYPTVAELSKFLALEMAGANHAVREEGEL